MRVRVAEIRIHKKSNEIQGTSPAAMRRPS